MTDQVEEENAHIKYCPTDNIWGDLMTNPTQGSKFRNLKNLVLGVNEKNVLISEGHGKIYIYTWKLGIVLLFDINKYNKRQDCVGEGRQMKGKMER